MANTFVFTPLGDDRQYSVVQLNALFTLIKSVIDQKLDLRESEINRDIVLINGTIINVPPPVEAGDLVQNGSRSD